MNRVERLHNDTKVELNSMPTEELVALFEQLEAKEAEVRTNKEMVLEVITGRILEASPEVGETSDLFDA